MSQIPFNLHLRALSMFTFDIRPVQIDIQKKMKTRAKNEINNKLYKTLVPNLMHNAGCALGFYGNGFCFHLCFGFCFHWSNIIVGYTIIMQNEFN